LADFLISFETLPFGISKSALFPDIYLDTAASVKPSFSAASFCDNPKSCINFHFNINYISGLLYKYYQLVIG